MREIKFYRTNSGRSPVEEFLVSLPTKARQKAVYLLKLIHELETVPREYFKKLRNTDDIWEVRIQFAGNIYRLLGFFEHNDLIILVNGFVKKTQKTPKKEIELAEYRKRQYLNRKR